jgi:heme-degrading monooxygenase HmoA
MYLTMNRFKVRKSEVDAFEAIWTGRDSHLTSVPGFKAFHLLKGPEAEDHVLYASHTAWEDEAAFLAWTRSEAFRIAHKDAGGSRDLYMGPPELEVFQTVQAIA